MRIRIIGLLSWWNEDAALLYNAVNSFSGVIDHLVAVDGRYGSLSASEATSGPDNYGAIMSVAAAQNIGLTIHRQVHAWQGDEVEKRTRMFELAEPLVEDGDWYCVIDSDEIAQKVPDDLKGALEVTDKLAADVKLFDPQKAPENIRILFKALPGLHCQDNHFTYVAGDGTVVWGNEFGGPSTPRPVDALDLSDEFHVLHLSDLDTESERHKAQQDYYRSREAEGRERSMCGFCGKVKAIRTIPWNFKPVQVPVIDKVTGKQRTMKSFEAQFADACQKCFKEQKRKNDTIIRSHGFDPDSQEFKRFKLNGLGVQRES